MSENFKEYIDQNRNSFDPENVPDHVWDSISEKLDEKEEKRRGGFFFLMKMAAILLLTFGLGFGISQWFFDSNSSQTVNGSEISQTGSNDVPEIYKIEDFYGQTINVLTSEVKNYESLNGKLVNEFITEHNRLDSIYQELKVRFEANNNSNQIMDLMVMNLRMRINVLEKQLLILRNIKNKKNNNNKNIKDEEDYI